MPKSASRSGLAGCGALAAIILLCAATRFFGLLVLPQFLDESWHISWSLKVSAGMSLVRPWLAGRIVPVAAGAVVLPWAHGHELAAGRILAVLSSLATVVAVFVLARRLFDARTALVAAVFYVFCPFTLFHDRLFLADPMLSCFVALAMLGSHALAREGRAWQGALTGLALTLAVLSKTSGVLLLFVPAAAWLLFSRPLRSAWRPLALAYAVAGCLLAVPLWIYLRTTSTIRITFAGRSVPLLERTLQNFALVREWLWTWGTPALCVLALAGLALALLRPRPATAFLALSLLLPLVALVPTAAVWYPRYVLFVALPGVILAAHALVAAVERVAVGLSLPSRVGAALLVAGATLALLPALAVDLPLWTDPPRAPMPTIDRFEYVEGWPSGYAVDETVALVAKERAAHPSGLTVVVQSRALPTTVMALSLAFRRDAGVRIEDLPLEVPAKAVPLLEAWARERPTVAVASLLEGRPRPPRETWGRLTAVLVGETRKPNGAPCDAVYRLAAPAP